MGIIESIKQKILQLGPGEFQILCDTYLSKTGYPNLVRRPLMSDKCYRLKRLILSGFISYKMYKNSVLTTTSSQGRMSK